MSWVKGDGAKIKITFDKALVGDVTGLNPVLSYTYQKITGTVTGSHAYSGYPVTNAADGLTTTFWFISGFVAGEWFKVQYPVAKAFPKWRMYLTSSGLYRPLSVIFQGSNDGTSWVDLSTVSVPAPQGTAGWVEFDTNNTTPYLYYRIYMNTCNDTSMGITEIQFCDRPTGNESHFTVTVPEYDYVPNGTLRNVTKAVKSVSAGDTSKEIVLEMMPLERFESAAGDITIVYDGLGSLAGSTGNVEAFSQQFSPSGLTPKPDQNNQEYIQLASATATGVLTQIQYINTASQAEGHIQLASATATGVLTHINNI